MKCPKHAALYFLELLGRRMFLTGKARKKHHIFPPITGFLKDPGVKNQTISG
jgi:hypothetical protein